jgi:DNA-directed RNA polymerase subunit N (RpoN/RPB10)
MLIPVRCPSCGHVLADKWEYYKRKLAEMKRGPSPGPTHKSFEPLQTKEILDELGLEKYCCRRVMLGHVDLVDEI